MLADLYAGIAGIPEYVLKAAGTLVGGIVVGGVYLGGRLMKLRTPPESAAGRVTLSETDRELGFTVIRTGTDLTRALHDHGEILRATFAPPPPPPTPPPVVPPRRTRVRRTTP